MADSDRLFESLEGKSQRLFLVAGSLLAVFAANTAFQTFIGESYLLVQSLVAPTGFLVGVLGLLGLYPALVDRTPTMARAAGLLAGGTAVYWIVLLAGSLGEIAGAIPASEAVFPIVFFFGIYVAMILTYAVFGIVVLRAGVQSRLVGLSLLGPAVMFLLLMVRAAPNYAIDAGHALFHLGAGILLWTDDVPSDQAELAPDSSV